MKATFELGEWLPDVPAYKNPGCTDVHSLIPFNGSYKVADLINVVTNSLTARARGMFSAAYVNATSTSLHVFTGDATKLYRMQASQTFSDVSKVGGYTNGTSSNWSFARFGDRIIATNYDDNPQSYIMNASSIFADLTTAFRARYVTTIRDFVVFAFTYDGSNGLLVNNVRWSAINDPTDYTASAATLSDSQTIPDQGAIKGIIGGEYGLVFTEDAIVRMTFVDNPDVIFQFDKICGTKGKVIEGTIVRIDENKIAYLTTSGPRFFNGVDVDAIGTGKNDEWFKNYIDPTTKYLFSSAIDHKNDCVVWAISRSLSNPGYSPLLLYWNYKENKFGKRLTDMDCIGNGYSDGNSSSEELSLVGFDITHAYGAFTDTPTQQSWLTTGERRLLPDQKATLRHVRALASYTATTDINDSTLQISTRNDLSESQTTTANISIGASKQFSYRSTGNFFQFYFVSGGGTLSLSGFELEFSPRGTGR